MKTKNSIRKKLAIGAILLATSLGGFAIGRESSKVSLVSFHEEGNSVSDYKVVRLHKPFAKDEIFVSMNGSRYDVYERKYAPIKRCIENSYGKNAEFSKRRIDDVHRLAGLESLD